MPSKVRVPTWVKMCTKVEPTVEGMARSSEGSGGSSGPGKLSRLGLLISGTRALLEEANRGTQVRPKWCCGGGIHKDISEAWKHKAPCKWRYYNTCAQEAIFSAVSRHQETGNARPLQASTRAVPLLLPLAVFCIPAPLLWTGAVRSTLHL